MSQPLRFSDGKKDFERCSIGHQDSRNLSVQVNWLSNNVLPGLEPRGLLPTCVLFQRVSHGDLQFPQSFSLAHVGTCASWNLGVHVFLTCLAFFAPEEGKGQLQHHCQWREVDTRMDAEVVKIFCWRMKRRGKNAIQHRTQSYSMF